MDYEVIWSGSLDRQGLAPHSSGYLGRSSLFICESRAPRETEPARLTEDERGEARSKAYKQRYSQTAHGKAVQAKADRDWRARVKAKRLALDLRAALQQPVPRQAEQAARYQARKAEQQQLLFGEA